MLTALDVRTLPPRDRHAEILKTFDALRPGGSFVLVNDHDPKPLLYLFQAERPGAFEWNVLERDPARFRVEVSRREGAGRRDVTEFLGADHDRLDALMDETERLVGRGDFVDALARFLEFKVGLEHHIDVEEKILFPEFERLADMPSGPTTVMSAEHVEIRDILGEIEDSLRGELTSEFIGAVGDLRQVLGDHNAKEEQILYPMTDRSLGADGADRLVRSMQVF